ncbi:class I SAM-dependent methyltransferase [Candidatus Leptofilum sp.]|uniref:class I SAM-dependent methyltransferase n=1 Tax=Candidatus Leptofilum sp. TaxID=3241576 RepID=UPI003B5CA89E
MVKTAYDKESASSYDLKRFTTQSGQLIHEIEVSILTEALNKLDTKEASILEVGCGTGRLLIEVILAGYKANGLDPSLHMLTQSRKKLQSDLFQTKLVLGEAAHLPFKTNHYEFVYTIRVLNQTTSHLYALDTIIEMIRIAKPNGLILVEFMNHYRLGLDRRRVRLGPEQVVDRVNKKNIRLRPKEIFQIAKNNNSNVVWLRGAFFFGMTGLNIMPEFAIQLVSKVDQFFSKLFPGLCSRCYILLQKDAA